MADLLLMRGRLLDMLDDFTTDMIEKPTLDAQGNVAHSLMLRDLELIAPVFKSYEDIVIGLKGGAGKQYAFKDMRTEELNKYRSVKHKIDLLWALYGEKDEAQN